MPPAVIAILDVGKTNKKLFLIDEHYKIVWEKTSRLPETCDEDGFACEDVQLLARWAKEGLQEMLALKDFDVKAFNFSTYGASFVHVDEQGQVAAPLYNYLKPYPPALQEQFFRRYGGEQAVSGATASPVLGSLNSGLQLYRLKHLQPELFRKIRYSLHLPQYLSFLLTGQACADITSIGCHTMLWDFRQQRYHDWVRQEGVMDKLPPLLPSDQALPVQWEGREYVSGTGLHDSSAALIPYLAGFAEPFALISTGTWCITLNPFNNSPLTEQELQHDCLCYLEYQGRPVKASRLFAGNEHEQQAQRLAEYFHVSPDNYTQVEFDPVLARELQTGAGAASPQLSRFAERPLSSFSSYAAAYHQLMLDIMAAQQQAARLVLDNTPVKRIFVDGGFSKNPLYMHLLAAAFPQQEVFAASVAQATAVGAALAIHRHWNSRALPGDLVELRYYSARRDALNA